ncbi:hypothetical protein EJD97_009229 [Solanum chilense]|uniref:Uncharacterized protein n=1 Tax=Solanum chilense TaxID=4083 RepID=A0A6N2CHX8_SOLCI|nr:hypothetical protein EJD97_009229 [Solanum chilense]
MSTRRNAGREIGGAASEVNQVPPQAPAAGMEMPLNPNWLTDGAVRTTLIQMAQSITLQAQAMTSQAEQQGVPRKKPHANTMANRLRDFTRMNPPTYIESKIVENYEEECRTTMLNRSMEFSRLVVCVQQVEENRKSKNTWEGNMSRQAEKNFLRMSTVPPRGVKFIQGSL